MADAAVDDVRAELVETVSAIATDGLGRVINGRMGPLICLACRVEGVGLVLSLALILTLGPCLAAVGDLALALPGKGAVAGPETERADLALVTDEVDAELLRRNRLRPGASTGAGRLALNVDGREIEESWVEEDAVDRTLAASESDMTREVVRGIPTGGPRRVRTRGESAEGPNRSSKLTSISEISSYRQGRLTITNLFQ